MVDDAVKNIRQRHHQKKYVDRRKRQLEFVIEDKIFLKVVPMKRVLRFGKKGKLSPKYISPFEILEHIGKVVYMLNLSASMGRIYNVFQVSALQKYALDVSHVLSNNPTYLETKLINEERPVQILFR